MCLDDNLRFFTFFLKPNFLILKGYLNLILVSEIFVVGLMLTRGYRFVSGLVLGHTLILEWGHCGGGGWVGGGEVPPSFLSSS